MVCDYYIIPYLEITHKYGIGYYPLREKRQYFIDFYSLKHYDSEYDTDDDNKRLKEFDEYVRRFELTPKKYKVIYCNGEFTCDEFREKYAPFLEKKINEDYYYDTHFPERDIGLPFKCTEDLIKVLKKEIRYRWGEEPDFYNLIRGDLDVKYDQISPEPPAREINHKVSVEISRRFEA